MGQAAAGDPHTPAYGLLGHPGHNSQYTFIIINNMLILMYSLVQQ